MPRTNEEYLDQASKYGKRNKIADLLYVLQEEGLLKLHTNEYVLGQSIDAWLEDEVNYGK